MKKIKIILPIALIAVLGFFIWSWSVKVKDPKERNLARNQYTDRIEKEIDSLGKASINVFCRKFYDGIRYRITDYHKQGFLGKTTNDNTQWQELLSKDLYSAYAPKFAQQALHVFNGSEWRINDINFIRSEVKTLGNSTYLEQESTVDSSFKNIQTILSKYDEIAGFISTCSNYSYTNYDIGISFPIDDMSSKIQRSKTYLSNGLDNIYVNNCTRLKDGLNNVPKKLFDKHVNYISSKIRQNSEKYRNYRYQSDYSKGIFEPLRNQIEELNNDIYGVSDNTFQIGYHSLESPLSDDNTKAFEYFRSLRNN